MNPKKLNVLFITRNLEFGGVERRVAMLAEYLDKDKFNVSVACMRNGGPYADHLQALGIQCYMMDIPSQMNPLVVYKLKKLMKQLNTDIADCHQTRANIWGTRAASKAGVPVIFSSNYLIKNWRNFALRKLEVGGFNLSDHLITDSQELKDDLLTKIAVSDDFIRVIPNGVPAPQIDSGEVKNIRTKFSLKPENKVAGMVGRLVPYKGQMVLLKAFARIADRFPHLKILIVGKEGEDGYLQTLHQFVNQHKLQKNVVITEYDGDVVNIMSVMDLFVLPSSGESLPISILESLSLQKPVIASDIGGIKNAVRDRENGFLIPEKDDAALADKIATLVADKMMMAQFSQKSAQLYRDYYSIEKMVGQVEDLFLATYSRKSK